MVKRAHEAKDNKLLFQKFQNGIFGIFKLFRNNMKFTKTAC